MLVFIAFVFAQIINSINSRCIDQHKNIFQGIHKNYHFMVITLIASGTSVGIFVGFISLPTIYCFYYSQRSASEQRSCSLADTHPWPRRALKRGLSLSPHRFSHPPHTQSPSGASSRRWTCSTIRSYSLRKSTKGYGGAMEPGRQTCVGQSEDIIEQSGWAVTVFVVRFEEPVNEAARGSGCCAIVRCSLQLVSRVADAACSLRTVFEDNGTDYCRRLHRHWPGARPALRSRPNQPFAVLRSASGRGLAKPRHG